MAETADPCAKTYRVIGLRSKGDGLAVPLDAEGRPGPVDAGVHVPFVLPGETIRFRDDGLDDDGLDDDGLGARDQAAWACGDARQALTVVVEASARRAEPVCQHFGACGGCSMQHAAPDLYASWKADLVRSAFAQRGLAVDLSPMVAVGHGARRRVVLTATRGQGAQQRPRSGTTAANAGCVVGFHATGSHTVVAIEMCPVADASISRALPRLRDLARRLLTGHEALRLSILAADNGLCVDVTGCERLLGAELRAELAALAKSADLLRLTVNSDPVALLVRPVVRFGKAEVVPPPGAFLQAARPAEDAMAQVVVGSLPKKAKRAADLFAGLGALTFPLAERVPVFACDSAADALGALETAARAASGLKTIETRRRDLIAEPLSRKELEPFDLVVFDPPRAGAKAQAEALAKSQVPVVVAVSCNPATLARDVRTLVDGGYRLESVTPIDQFLYSHHVEAVAVLKRVRRR